MINILETIKTKSPNQQAEIIESLVPQYRYLGDAVRRLIKTKFDTSIVEIRVSRKTTQLIRAILLAFIFDDIASVPYRDLRERCLSNLNETCTQLGLRFSDVSFISKFLIEIKGIIQVSQEDTDSMQ